MKNDKRKSMLVILLRDGKPEFSDSTELETYCHGRIGFMVRGLSRVLYWADEGKTWKRAEETR